MSKAVQLTVVVALLTLAGAARAQEPTTARSLRVTPVVKAYRAAGPAVVNISTERLVRMGSRMFGQRDDPFEEFMSNIFGRAVPAISLGSGFLIHADGYIITNAHVVRRAQKITISLADKSSFQASVVATNPDHDLALLKIDSASGRKFPFLRLGRSDDLMIGETVIAIGNPLGYQNTCTTGVLSSLDRTLTFRGGTTYSGLIQIDAPINPGNSGGPLLNIAGELIGINTAIRADAQGIGFAVPIDSLKADLPKLVDFERLNRVVLGLKVSQIVGRTEEEVVVTGVTPGSPAAKAGCKKGDRLLSLDAKPVRQLPDYLVAMLNARAGQKVTLGCERDGKQISLEAVLQIRPKPDVAALAWKHFGLRLQAVTPELAKQMRLRAEAGLLVTSVEAGGPSERLGLRRGDIIFQLGRWYVTDLDRVGAVLEDVQAGQKLRIGIIRGNVRAWTVIEARRFDTSPPPKVAPEART